MSYARFNKAVQEAGVRLGMVCILVFVGFPILWVLLTAFKSQKDAFSSKLLFVPTLQNFQHIFTPPTNFAPFLVNSIIIALATVAVSVPLATLAAYAFSRYSFVAKDAVLILLIATQFIAPVVIVIPFFNLYSQLGLIDSRLGLIILYLSFSLPFAVWIIKGFVDALPTEIEEAAVVDGCTPHQVLRYVTLPLIKPGIITAAIFAFIGAWNEFLFALVTTTSNQTLTVGMMVLAFQEGGVQWEIMAATGMVVMIPVFILSLTIRDHFVEGITMGAVK
jgi:multiple sugar transport system permease protein